MVVNEDNGNRQNQDGRERECDDETALKQPVETQSSASPQPGSAPQPPVPAPRQTAGPRTRMRPSWMTSGDYILRHQTLNPVGEQSDFQRGDDSNYPEESLEDVMTALKVLPDSIYRVVVRQMLSNSGNKF